ncbi:hypothetical protein PENTCL1PPCAC_20949, partial [Pristionchus entomophagus]
MVLDASWLEHEKRFGHAGIRPVHLAAFALAILNCVLNGLIWYAFHVCSKIINKSHLYLFYALAVTNCLTGFFSVPTFINLFAHDNINCPKWTILVGSAFEMALDRMRAILALAIAIERLFAVHRPHAFFHSDHRKIRTHCVSTSSSGPMFHAYFLITSLLDGLALFAVYVAFLVKFLSIRKSSLETSPSPEVR